MLQVQKDYINKNIKMLIGSIQHCLSSTEKHNSQIGALQKRVSPSKGPNCKRPRHRNEEEIQFQEMDNEDTCLHNRGALAPDPRGLGEG
eukprot:737034-Ditylum_brightwellii.AAC.1